MMTIKVNIIHPDGSITLESRENNDPIPVYRQNKKLYVADRKVKYIDHSNQEVKYLRISDFHYPAPGYIPKEFKASHKNGSCITVYVAFQYPLSDLIYPILDTMNLYKKNLERSRAVNSKNEFTIERLERKNNFLLGSAVGFGLVSFLLIMLTIWLLK